MRNMKMGLLGLSLLSLMACGPELAGPEGTVQGQYVEEDGYVEANYVEEDGYVEANYIEQDGVVRATYVEEDGVASVDYVEEDGVASVNYVEENGLLFVAGDGRLFKRYAGKDGVIRRHYLTAGTTQR